MAGFESRSNQFSSTLNNVGSAFQGSNLTGRDFIFNAGPSQEAKRDDCVAALFLTNPRDDRQKHVTFKGDVTPGTCTWIEQDEIYRSWKTQESTRKQLIWLSAGGGKGKTMLSIYATRELEKLVQHGKMWLLLYYFCDARDESRNTAVAVLRSLIYQMILQLPSLTDLYIKTYNVQRNNLFRHTSIEPLWHLFETMVQKCGMERIYCWIDGADECEVDSLHHLLKKIKSFFKGQSSVAPNDDDGNASAQRQASLRMIIVSREQPACLSEELSTFPRVTFAQGSEGKNSRDLEVYIRAKAKDITKKASDSIVMENLVSEGLKKNGDGTFLWVDIAAERLQLSPPVDLSQQIQHLSSDLEEMLCQNLMLVPPEWAPFVQASLKWVLLAVRPLQQEELKIAVGLSTGTTITSQQLTTTISLCGSLLTMRNQEVVLAHHTMRSFLLSPSSKIRSHSKLSSFVFEETVAHSELTNLCIAYLESGSLHIEKGMKSLRKLLQLSDYIHVANSDGSKMSGYERTHLAKYPFLNYAVLSWPQHARLGNTTYTNYGAGFFAPKSTVRNIWWKSYWISTRSKAASSLITPTEFSLLHVAAYCGIIPLALHIERNGNGWLSNAMQTRDDHACLPLHWAIDQNWGTMTRFLFDRGAHDIPKDSISDYETPLIEMAIACGEVETVEFLLGHGQPADTYMVQWSASDFAKMSLLGARYWKSQVVEWSKEKRGRDMARNIHCGDPETLLHLAAVYGHHSVAEKLLAYGANVNRGSELDWQPIHDAAWYGYPDFISLLMQAGANAAATTSRELYTPLHCAAHEGQTESIRRLLSYGVSVNEKTFKGKTPLHTASKVDNTAVLELLLNAGADIEATCNVGLTPLHYAAFMGTGTVVEYLLVRGADAGKKEIKNAEGTKILSALDFANNQNQKLTANLLIAYERDPDGFKKRSKLWKEVPQETQSANGPRIEPPKIDSPPMLDRYSAGFTTTPPSSAPVFSSTLPLSSSSEAYAAPPIRHSQMGTSPPPPTVPFSQQATSVSLFAAQKPTPQGISDISKFVPSPPQQSPPVPSMEFASPQLAPQSAATDPAPIAHEPYVQTVSPPPLSQPTNHLNQTPPSLPPRPFSTTLPLRPNLNITNPAPPYLPPPPTQVPPYEYPQAPPPTSKPPTPYIQPLPHPTQTYPPPPQVQIQSPYMPHSPPSHPAENYLPQPEMQVQPTYMPPTQAVMQYQPSPLSPPLMPPPNGMYFAGPPQQQALNHQVKKSRSFVDLTVLGRKLL